MKYLIIIIILLSYSCLVKQTQTFRVSGRELNCSQGAGIRVLDTTWIVRNDTLWIEGTGYFPLYYRMPAKISLYENNIRIDSNFLISH